MPPRGFYTVVFHRNWLVKGTQLLRKYPLQVAVIGAGMGRYGLLPSFLQNNRFQIAAVCSSSKESADRFATQYNIPKSFSSWRSLLQENLDLVAIATPPAVQAEITHAFLEKKIPLFLEKQIALNLSQSKQLLDLCVRNGVPTCVNFIFPYLHTWQLLRTYLKENRIGQIRQIFLNWRMESYDQAKRTPNHWKTNDQLGGGVLQHFLSHSFHYLEVLFGKIAQLRCILRTAPDLSQQGSAFASLDLEFDNRLFVHVAASNSAYSGIGHSLEIYGSEGSLILKNESKDPVSGFQLHHAARGASMNLIASEIDYYTSNSVDSRVLPTSHLVEAFLHSLDGGGIAHPTIEDGDRVQELLDCAYTAHLNRCCIKVPKGNYHAKEMENTLAQT